MAAPTSPWQKKLMVGVKLKKRVRNKEKQTGNRRREGLKRRDRETEGVKRRKEGYAESDQD